MIFFGFLFDNLFGSNGFPRIPPRPLLQSSRGFNCPVVVVVKGACVVPALNLNGYRIGHRLALFKVSMLSMVNGIATGNIRIGICFYAGSTVAYTVPVTVCPFFARKIIFARSESPDRSMSTRPCRNRHYVYTERRPVVSPTAGAQHYLANGTTNSRRARGFARSANLRG